MYSMNRLVFAAGVFYLVSSLFRIIIEWRDKEAVKMYVLTGCFGILILLISFV